jgi:hypothetical protein
LQRLLKLLKGRRTFRLKKGVWINLGLHDSLQLLQEIGAHREKRVEPNMRAQLTQDMKMRADLGKKEGRLRATWTGLATL